jgi:hypothetical protein
MRSEIEGLTVRVARLERANRRLKLISVGVVSASRALISMGLGGLYFSNGHQKPLVNLSSGPIRPELQFYGPDGKISWSAP